MVKKKGEDADNRANNLSIAMNMVKKPIHLWVWGQCTYAVRQRVIVRRDGYVVR